MIATDKEIEELQSQAVKEFAEELKKRVSHFIKFFYGYVVDTTPTCLSEEEIQNYGKNKSVYFWFILNLRIYDKPKELSEFYTRCRLSDKKCRLCDNCFEREDSYGRYYAVKKLTRPPQSWMGVEEL